jgi:hypothetical protein
MPLNWAIFRIFPSSPAPPSPGLYCHTNISLISWSANEQRVPQYLSFCHVLLHDSTIFSTRKGSARNRFCAAFSNNLPRLRVSEPTPLTEIGQIRIRIKMNFMIYVWMWLEPCGLDFLTLVGIGFVFLRECRFSVGIGFGFGFLRFFRLKKILCCSDGLVTILILLTLTWLSRTSILISFSQ